MPTIYDNIENQFLQGLSYSLQDATSADFCVGYFNLRGWRGVADYVDRWEVGEDSCCRLLIGMQKMPLDMVKAGYAKSGPGMMDNATASRIKKQLAQEFRDQLVIGAPTEEDEKALRKLLHQIIDKNVSVGARHASPLQKPPGVPKRSLSAIVGSYKSAVSREINHLRKMAGITIWQRNYYDHIIRKDTVLNAIRRYIHYNPLLWQFDSDNIPCRGEACLAPTTPTFSCLAPTLLQHYGFTDEELDFIINYDIKYRMGKGSGEEDGDE